MTGMEAQAIFHQCISYEFPFVFDYGLRIALFKTYVAENIGRLLVATSDLNTRDVGKRYEDTEVIFASFFAWPPSSTALHDFVSRMNYLHEPYVKSGKIISQDVLYILYLSLVEPIKLQRMCEWRSLTDMEIAAQATVWYYIGDMMGIDYEQVLGNHDWADGIDFLQALTAWSIEYEELHVKRLPEVHRLGVRLIELLLSTYPKVLHPIGYQMALLFLGERLRHAMSLPEPGLAVSAVVYPLLLLRKMLLRFLILPRIFAIKTISDVDPNTGKVHHYRYLKEPWYVAPTFWGRWGPSALYSRIMGIQVPGQGGPEMKPGGFYVDDVGPRRTLGKGAKEMAVIRERVRQVGERVADQSPFARELV